MLVDQPDGARAAPELSCWMAERMSDSGVVASKDSPSDMPASTFLADGCSCSPPPGVHSRDDAWRGRIAPYATESAIYGAIDSGVEQTTRLHLAWVAYSMNRCSHL